jgi:hypothetical protein
MNALHQIANDAATIDNTQTSDQPLLVLDALDLLTVGGGADVVVF